MTTIAPKKVVAAKPVVEKPVEVPPPVVNEPVQAKKKVVKAAVPPPAVVTPPPAVVTPPTVEVKVQESKSDDKKEDVPAVSEDDVIQSLVDKITALASLVKEVQSAIKPVVKEHERQRKIIERIQKKRDNARKSPSGFAKPNKISNELCDFINVPHGTEKSRTDITRYINAYVKEHNLNKPSNRRVIIPDEKLKAILKINEGEEVTFFILQRLISHHFPPKQSSLVQQPVVAAV